MGLEDTWIDFEKVRCGRVSGMAKVMPPKASPTKVIRIPKGDTPINHPGLLLNPGLVNTLRPLVC